METIKSRQEFESVFRQGRRFNSKLVRTSVLRDEEGDLGRVAFVAPKRLGNAVFRNRCKRVLREAARSCELPRDGFDVILFATGKTATSTPDEVAQSLRVLLKKAGA